MLSYPDMEGRNIVWKQSTNPFISSTVGGFELVSNSLGSTSFNGLARSSYSTTQDGALVFVDSPAYSSVSSYFAVGTSETDNTWTSWLKGPVCSSSCASIAALCPLSSSTCQCTSNSGNYECLVQTVELYVSALAISRECLKLSIVFFFSFPSISKNCAWCLSTQSQCLQWSCRGSSH